MTGAARSIRPASTSWWWAIQRAIRIGVVARVLVLVVNLDSSQAAADGGQLTDPRRLQFPGAFVAGGGVPALRLVPAPRSQAWRRRRLNTRVVAVDEAGSGVPYAGGRPPHGRSRTRRGRRPSLVAVVAASGASRRGLLRQGRFTAARAGPQPGRQPAPRRRARDGATHGDDRTPNRSPAASSRAMELTSASGSRRGNVLTMKEREWSHSMVPVYRVHRGDIVSLANGARWEVTDRPVRRGQIIEARVMRPGDPRTTTTLTWPRADEMLSVRRPTRPPAGELHPR